PAKAPNASMTSGVTTDDHPSRLGGRVRKEGSIVATGPASFARVVTGQLDPIRPPKTDVAELAALTALRDTMAELLDTQTHLGDNDVFLNVQTRLNTLYDRYAS